MRARSLFFATALLVLATPCSALARAQVIAPLHFSESAKPISFRGGKALLVRSMTVSSSAETRVQLTCGCVRYPTTTSQSQAKPGVIHFGGLNFILRADSRVQLTVSRAGFTGRFLILKAASPLGRPDLVEVASGCLEGNAKVACSTQSPTSPPPKPTPPKPAPIEAPVYRETAGGVVHTHADFAMASGEEGPAMEPGQTVEVRCKVLGFAVEDGDTWWYRIASAPWSDRFYASADAFYNNGQTSGSLVGTPFVDPAVREC